MKEGHVDDIRFCRIAHLGIQKMRRSKKANPETEIRCLKMKKKINK